MLKCFVSLKNVFSLNLFSNFKGQLLKHIYILISLVFFIYFIFITKKYFIFYIILA